MKHLPFESNYREKFEVVEQVQGDQRLFPHTEQLPVLHRALNLEFYNGLPEHIARVDERGDGFHKYLLKQSGLMFCAIFNAARRDGLRLYELLDPDLVARVTVVQQVTRATRRGNLHGFRFYGGEDFFPEIYLSGKRLWFTDHVLHRFSTRVPNNVGEDLCSFLLAFYGTPLVSLPVGHGRGFMVLYGESVLAFTYAEGPEECVITTCLTVNEMNSLRLEIPTPAFNLHYGRSFIKPKLRTWLPHAWAADLHRRWERKAQLPPPAPLPDSRKCNWHFAACRVRDIAVRRGNGPGLRLRFLDDIPGPNYMLIRPGGKDPQFDEETFTINAAAAVKSAATAAPAVA